MYRFALPLLAFALAGCGGDPPPLDMASTPEKSRALLESTFDAWKAGGTPASLAAKSPPVYLSDENFATGVKLVDYKIEGEPKIIGIGYSYTLTLTLQDGAKASTTKKVAYRVVTQPNLSVAKEDRAP